MARPPRQFFTRATELAFVEDNVDAPYGRVEGIALVYDVVDDHGTLFAPGCLDRTRQERVTPEKSSVMLCWDHGEAPLTGYYSSDLHIGTVRSLTDIRLPDGRLAAYMVADFANSPKAEEAREKLRSLLKHGGTMGLSVGFRARKATPGKNGVERGTRFLEIELREISITSMQSVPDAEVLAVRSSPERLFAALDVLIASLGPANIRAALDDHEAQSASDDMQGKQDEGDAPAADSDAGTGSSPSPDSNAEAQDSRSEAPPTEPEYATEDARIRAIRSSYAA